MVRVTFTPNLQRHIDCPPTDVIGNTVREVLDAVFQQYPNARSYVLNDQGGVRHHMTVFVDNEQIRDREGLSDTVSQGSEIYIMQALSGG